MDIKRGIPVSAGVVIGPALVLDTDWFRIPRRTVDPTQIPGEIARLRKAMAAAADDARAHQRTIGAQLGRHYGAIFEAHALLMEDPALLTELEALIHGQSFAAEYALSRVTRRYAKAFESLDNGLSLGTKAADLFDIERRVLSHLLGQKREQLKDLREPVVVLAHDLTPSETAQLDPNKVHAFVTEAGGRTSHTAIMAGALEIPAVVGVGKFITDVSGGDEVIVDGDLGLLILNPDDETRRQYERAKKTMVVLESRRNELRDLPAVTKDGCRIYLYGNIEFPSEAAHIADRGADGVGLYRTEFLYLGHTTDPSESEHFAAYRQVVEAVPAGQPVVIRTLDLGADKFTTAAEPPHERNPFLGVRSVRLCLRNLPLFKTQLRAILRASVYGSVKILFPMISTLLELRQCKMLLAEVREDLEEAGIPFARDVSVGTMIEVPSAALMAGQLAREADFLSIGTNDLVQYTLAADRTNEHVAGLYSASDPAVLRLIREVIEAGRAAGVDVNVCGEMSGDPLYTILLLGMGLRQFSVTPHNIPDVKRVVRSVTLAEAEQLASEVARMETAKDITNYLREQTRRVVPDAIR